MLPLLLGGCVFPSDRRPAVDASVQAATQYVFRGQVMTNRPVLQPAAAIHLPTRGGGTTTARGWGNVDLTEEVGRAWFGSGNAGEFTEIDLSLIYTHRIEPIDVGIGLIHYSWPFGDTFPFRPFRSTSEVVLRVGGDVLGLQPALTVHGDFDEAESVYARAELGRGFQLAQPVRLSLLGWLGWSEAKHSLWLYRTRESALADAGASVTLHWDADDVTSIYAGVAASTIVDQELRDWFRPRVEADNVTATLGVAWAW
jgi:hypothetical protein